MELEETSFVASGANLNEFNSFQEWDEVIFALDSFGSRLALYPDTAFDY